MKMKTWIVASIMVIALNQGAYARPMSTMEWVDPKGFEIWKSLSAAEKTDSIKAMLEQNGGGTERKPEDQQYLLAKTQDCIDKEAADPDYKDVQVPLMMPWTYCMSKYTAIVENKAK